MDVEKKHMEKYFSMGVVMNGPQIYFARTGLANYGASPCSRPRTGASSAGTRSKPCSDEHSTALKQHGRGRRLRNHPGGAGLVATVEALPLNWRARVRGSGRASLGTMSNDSTRPIRTAVAGFGLSGSVFHAPFIAANPAYSLDAICHLRRRQAVAAARSYPAARIVDTPADILELAGELDLLVLGTPPATHYPLAKAALEAGLDVVVDKPFAVSSAAGAGTDRPGRAAGPGAHGVPEPALGRRLPHRQAPAGRGCLGHRDAVRIPLRAVVARRSPRPGRRRPRRTTAAGCCSTSARTCWTRPCSSSGPATVTHAELPARRPGEKADDDVFVALRHESGVLATCG